MKAFAQRIKRTGSDVAKNDAERGEREREEVPSGRLRGVRVSVRVCDRGVDVR